jgi:N-dimethylarginine dimethylaminohydrolase
MDLITRERPADTATLERPAVGAEPRQAADAAAAAAIENSSPGTLDQPVFLMNLPLSYTADCPNNAWMEELDEAGRQVDRARALTQFGQVYQHLAAGSVVFLLPAPANCRLQDLVFTANLGIVLEHLPGRDTVVLSNFTSEPRKGETAVGKAFFEALGYTIHVARHRFEGEADLKHLHGNVYVGGFGMRSERRTYDWMEAQFGMEIVKLGMVDKYLYHLDCSIFPLTVEDTMVCTELYTKAEIAELGRHTNVIDVSADAAFSGICNSVRHHNLILNGSHLHELKAGSDDYFEEVKKNRELEDLAIRLGLEVQYFNLSEYHKGGALLSCMVMHLNRRSYAFTLI